MTEQNKVSLEAEAGVPTLEDVARASGVSTATVSRCLNEPERVTEQTRARVMEAVRSLGYAPNFSARALAAKRTGIFGAIVPTLENAIFAKGLQAFQEELARHGITLLVASSSYSPALEEEQVRALIARGADALLLIGHDRTPETYALLEQRQMPHIVAWAYDPSEARLSIGFDNRKAMKRLATEVLLRGHARLGVITAAVANNDRTRERVAGVRDAMAAQDLSPDDLRVVETPYGAETGARAFEEIMRSDPRPTAVLCANDVLAAGALAKARDLGLRVPDDVSVTGFDDTEIAQIVTPQLTSVRVPHWDMGEGAARLLVAWRSGERAKDSIELSTEVVQRGSLGAAPQE
ncbi:MAG: LacI family DNA-binding transcriptional regulator [Pseudomonadota bacterium]